MKYILWKYALDIIFRLLKQNMYKILKRMVDKSMTFTNSKGSTPRVEGIEFQKFRKSVFLRTKKIIDLDNYVIVTHQSHQDKTPLTLWRNHFFTVWIWYTSSLHSLPTLINPTMHQPWHGVVLMKRSLFQQHHRTVKWIVLTCLGEWELCLIACEFERAYRPKYTSGREC